MPFILLLFNLNHFLVPGKNYLYPQTEAKACILLLTLSFGYLNLTLNPYEVNHCYFVQTYIIC